MFFRCKFQVKASIEADTILAIDWMIIMQILVSESTELWVIHCLYTKLKQCTTIGWISVCYNHFDVHFWKDFSENFWFWNIEIYVSHVYLTYFRKIFVILNVFVWLQLLSICIFRNISNYKYTARGNYEMDDGW